MMVAVPAQRDGAASFRVRTYTPVLLRGVAALLVVIVTASPWGDRLLETALPVQRTVYGWLMPDFRVYEFGFAWSANHLKIQALAISHHYLSLQGQAIPPGMGMTGQTPARMALTYAALVLIGSILLMRGPAMRLVRAGVLAATLSAAMLCVITPLIMAGQQWAALVEPFSEPSAAAWLGGLSDVLLHGGGYGLAALCVLLVRLAARGSFAEIRRRRQS